MSGALVRPSLRVIGLSHQTAPVALRERLAFRAEDLPHALARLHAAGCTEAAILSTCNRVEIIFAAPASETHPGVRVRHFLSEFHNITESDFAPSLYELEGSDAARHVFEVAASLDSQILGETEILAQSKEAYRVATEAGTCGPILRGLFERAFFLSKELRGDDGIGRSRASVSSAAVALAQKLFELKGRKILVVGTGEMARGIVRSLSAAGVSEILVASRTEDRAAEFAKQEGGKPCEMKHLPDHLAVVDIVLVSTAAPHHIIGPAHIREAATRRRGRVLCMIDISVPRNVDPAVHELDDVFLYDIDDLEEVARDGRREREDVAGRWRPKLAEEARLLLRQLYEGGAQDAARGLIEHAESLRREVLQQARTAGLDERAIEEISRALERLQGRLLHGPLETLKQATRDGDGADAAAWISRLFKLEPPVLKEDKPEGQSESAGEGGPKNCKGEPMAARTERSQTEDSGAPTPH